MLQELEFLFKIGFTSKSNGSVYSKCSDDAGPASQVYLEFQHNLEQYLRNANQSTADGVCSWIQVIFRLFILK